MNLWLDAGNTRLKWQLYDGNVLLVEGNYTHAADFEAAAIYLYESLSAQVDVLDQVKFIALASVLNEEAKKRFLTRLKKLFGIDVQVARVTATLGGVECAYVDVNKLGIDRWLAVVAAFQLYQSPVCVVDCGSALTIDMVNSAGKHLGGFILPGLNMSIKALLGQTQSVRFQSDSSLPTLDWGVNTAQAVKNGALLLSVGAVNQAWLRLLKSEAELEHNNLARLVLTGGDAALLADFLEIKFELIDDLVLKGLRFAV